MKIKIIKLLLLFLMIGTNDAQSQTVNFSYDASGNLNLVDSPFGCPCECPPNKDSWLTLISDRDTDDSECGLTTCKITHVLDIDPQYDCYTHYVIEDGTTTTHIAPLPANKQLALIDRCLQNGEVLDLRLELYTSIYDTDPCVIEKSYECPVYCECPEDAVKEDWLTLEVEPGTQAYPDKCEVTYEMEINEYNSCFPYIWRTYDLYNADGSLKEHGGESYFVPNTNESDFAALPKSIGKDERLRVDIIYARYIYSENGSEEPSWCRFYKEVSCSYSCCDYIDVVFTPVEGEECTFFANIMTSKEDLCSLDNVEELTVFDITDEGQEDPLDAVRDSDTRWKLTLKENTQRIKYFVTINGEECEPKELDLSCGSDCSPCPSERQLNSWFEYYIDKYSDKCEPGQCFIGQHLNIPEGFSSCYKGYTISYILRGNGVTDEFSNHSKDPRPIPADKVLPELPSCVDPGKVMQVNIRLYDHDGNICEIFSDLEFCQLATNPSRGDACISEYDEYGGTVEIEDCEYKFLYRFGFSEEGYQDIEITYIETDDDECSVNEEVLMQEILKAAILDAITNSYQAEPRPDKDGCADKWRVYQSSCWSSWIVNRPGPYGYEIQTIEVPCGSSCCSRHLQVCIIDGKMSVKDLGVAPGSATSDCSRAKENRPAGALQIEPAEHCNDKTCEIYVDIDGSGERDYIRLSELYDDLLRDAGKYLGDVIITQGKIRSNDNIVQPNYIYQLNHYQDMIEMIIAESNIDNMEIQIFNLLGQEQNHFNFKLNGGMQSLQIPTDRLKSGTYIMTISNNGNIYESIKINIVK